MEPRSFLTVFAAVFIAELGDKTQIATMLFASNRDADALGVFAAASLALVTATGIGVLAGHLLSGLIDEKALGYLAGAGFVAIGAWTLYVAHNS